MPSKKPMCPGSGQPPVLDVDGADVCSVCGKFRSTVGVGKVLIVHRAGPTSGEKRYELERRAQVLMRRDRTAGVAPRIGSPRRRAWVSDVVRRAREEWPEQ